MRTSIEPPPNVETGDCSEWPIHSYPPVSTADPQSHARQLDLATETDLRMKNEVFEHQHPTFSQAHFARRASQQEQTVSPAKLGHSSDTPPGPGSSRPTLGCDHTVFLPRCERDQCPDDAPAFRAKW